MSYPRKWYHGVSGDLEDAIAKYGSLYLTDDYTFAEGYGWVYEVTLVDGLRVFDSGDSEEVQQEVEGILEGYEGGTLPYELERAVERLLDENGNGVAEALADELSPDGIESESAYDMTELQYWLFEERGYDLVLFHGKTTALLLDAVEGVDHFELVDERA